MGLLTRLQHGFNAFLNRDPTRYTYSDIGPGYSYRPDRVRFSRSNERSIVTAIYNRIALDAASMTLRHCRLDENGQVTEIINSGLHTCLSTEANIDQTGRSFMHDMVMSMLDEGCVSAVPIDTTTKLTDGAAFDILSMRTGKVTGWHPAHVELKVYNDRKGEKSDLILPKTNVAIVENPFYAVMNEPNSTAQRLIRKLNLLDAIDEKSGSDKLDLIIQLPYVVKTDARRAEADKRRKDIEMQLSSSNLGIAYIDGTEKVTQLNRSVENNLLKQIEYLTNLLMSQLNITQSIMDGTADEQTMLNYYTRTIEPIVSAIVDEMNRKFLSKTARTQGQAIKFFRDPFKLVPVNNIADIADKFTRNEILTANEVRQIIGLMPSKDPKADKLINSTIRQPEESDEKSEEKPAPENEVKEEGGESQNGV